MTLVIFEGVYDYINILREMKVYNLHGRKHLLDDDYNNDIKSSIFNSY